MLSYFVGYIDLVRCVLVLRCGTAVVVWYPYAGWSTSASTQHISRKLLRMDVLTSETCRALSKEIIKQVTSSWSLFTQLTSGKVNLFSAQNRSRIPRSIAHNFSHRTDWSIQAIKYKILVSVTLNFQMSTGVVSFWNKGHKSTQYTECVPRRLLTPRTLLSAGKRWSSELGKFTRIHVYCELSGDGLWKRKT